MIENPRFPHRFLTPTHTEIERPIADPARPLMAYFFTLKEKPGARFDSRSFGRKGWAKVAGRRVLGWSAIGKKGVGSTPVGNAGNG
jgi:hypothetical protein